MMKMCLAVPAKILTIKNDEAEVGFGTAISRKINIMLVDAKVGDYVLVHAGYAIQVLDANDAQETLRLWNDILEAKP
jgi:hydrogenase expression/formation protein HypC